MATVRRLTKVGSPLQVLECTRGLEKEVLYTYTGMSVDRKVVQHGAIGRPGK